MEASSTRRRSAKSSHSGGSLFSGPPRVFIFPVPAGTGTGVADCRYRFEHDCQSAARRSLRRLRLSLQHLRVRYQPAVDPYDSTSTYGRAFIVGGLNTVLVASLGIVAATIIGFLAGVLRLSSNYLISRIVTVYVEFTRNVPLLLQIIFWWVIILSLPRVGDSIEVGGAFYLNNRGVRLPAPVFAEGAVVLLIAFALGVVATVALGPLGQGAPGRHRAQVPGRLDRPGADPGGAGGALLRAWPSDRVRAAGDGQIQPARGLKHHPGAGGAVDRAGHLHRLVHLGNRARRHTVGEQGADRGRRVARTAVRADAAQGHPAAGAARHRAAADQPVPESDQELLAGGRDRLPGLGVGRQHHPEPERPSAGGDLHLHDHLPVPEPAHFRVDELVQTAASRW